MKTFYWKAGEAGALEAAAEILKKGGLVAIPTETVYGLAANALDGNAARKIFAAKGRPVDNPLIVHISDMKQIDLLAAKIPEQVSRLAKAFWPGPLTLLLPKKACVPDEVTGGLPTVGIRFPSHPVAQRLIELAGVPLAAPSANLSGHPSPSTAEHVWHDFFGRIDGILDGGPCQIGVESTVLNLSEQPPRLLRPGGVTLEQLQAVLGTVEVDPAITQPLAEGKQAPSPGMKYKHYSPLANVTLVRAASPDFCRFVNAHRADGVAALCFDEEKEELLIPCLAYGSASDSWAQARRLFEALREVDDSMHAKQVYVHCPLSTVGMGLAVYNRLIRAAGFEVIDLD